MDVPKKRRFRFGLRTLLLLVGACAIACGIHAYRLRLLPPEVREVWFGMSRADAATRLGLPYNAAHHNPRTFHRWGETWIYFYDWGELTLKFPPGDDRCSSIDYWVYSENRSHVLNP